MRKSIMMAGMRSLLDSSFGQQAGAAVLEKKPVEKKPEPAKAPVAVTPTRS